MKLLNFFKNLFEKKEVNKLEKIVEIDTNDGNREKRLSKLISISLDKKIPIIVGNQKTIDIIKEKNKKCEVYGLAKGYTFLIKQKELKDGVLIDESLSKDMISELVNHTKIRGGFLEKEKNKIKKYNVLVIYNSSNFYSIGRVMKALNNKEKELEKMIKVNTKKYNLLKEERMYDEYSIIKLDISKNKELNLYKHEIIFDEIIVDYQLLSDPTRKTVEELINSYLPKHKSKYKKESRYVKLIDENGELITMH